MTAFPSPSPFKVGVSPLAWTNDVLHDLGDDIPLEVCLAEARAAGYAGVELGRRFPRQAAALRPLLERHGLALASGWHSGLLAEAGVADELDRVGAHAELLRSMGSTVLVYGECGCMVPGDPLSAPMSRRLTLAFGDMLAYADRLTEFGDRLVARWGLRLAYHHHLMMVAETFDEVSALFDRVGPSVQLLLDTGHAAAAGFAPEDLIARFGARIGHVHLKDLRRTVMERVRRDDLSFNAGVRAGMFTVPGDGCVDFGPVARWVRESGYAGWLIVEAEQDPKQVPPLATVSRARQYIAARFEDSRPTSV